MSLPAIGLESATHEAADQIENVIAEVKPRLRGWLHLATIPLTMAAGSALVFLSPTTSTRLGSSIFMGSALALVAVSATYHRGTWSPRAAAALRRLDHANNFLLIAGSYTAYSVLLLRGEQRAVLLSLVWGGAFLGVLFRVCWINAPRWLHTSVYVFWAGRRSCSVRLPRRCFTFGCWRRFGHSHLVGGRGGLYTLGGVVYGFQRPNPWPQWFGFFEVFHSLTILAFATHLAGVGLATMSMR